MTLNTTELEMELELEAVKSRYAKMFEDSEVDVGGVQVKPLKGNTSEAWVIIYSAKDGTASRVTTDAASRKIKQRNPDGTPQFLLHPEARFRYRRDPVTAIPQKLPDTVFLCRLHPDHPERAWLDSIGLAGQTCTVDTIPTAYQVEAHMQVKHKREFAAIVREEGRQREQEAMNTQKAMAEAMQAMARGQGGLAGAPPDLGLPEIFRCERPGCARFFDSEHGRSIHQGKEH